MKKFHEHPFRTPEERHAAASLGVPERQAMIERLLYKYPVFKQGEQFIREFHFPFEGGTPGKGTVGGLLGESRTGKTTICKYYAAGVQTPPADENGEYYPIIHITVTIQSTASTLTDMIAAKTGMRSIPAKIKTEARTNMVKNRLRQVRTELIILDDAQFMFVGRNRLCVTGFHGLLKQLADMMCLNVLLVGEQVIHENVDHVDYVRNRGGFKRETLVALSDSGRQFEDFRLLLSKIDARLPFKERSILHHSSALAADIHAFTDGSIGRVTELIREAAAVAMNDKAACIRLEHFAKVATRLVRLGDKRVYFKRA